MLDAPWARLRSRYSGRYRYRGSRLLMLAALDSLTLLLPRGGARRVHAGGTVGEPRRILLIRVDGIGDVVAMLPALDALRARYPHAEIDLLTSPAAARLVEGDTRIDDLLVTRFLYEDATRGRNRLAPVMREWLATVRLLRARRYDLAIDFRGDIRTILWLAYASGARRRLSWSNISAGRHLLTDAPASPGALHEVEANLRLVETLGVPAAGRSPRLPISPEAAERAEALLESVGLRRGRPRVGFHCFAISPLRTWPAERFAAVIDTLARETGAGAVLLGSRAEEAAARELLALTGCRPVSLVGRTSLQELAAVLSQLDLLVCLDSGLLHIAAAVGTPTVSLFGPGDPARWGPRDGRHAVLWRGLPCSPCRDIRCVHATNRCLQEISVAEVVGAARRQLGAGALLQL